jgi:hypothetical protein
MTRTYNYGDRKGGPVGFPWAVTYDGKVAAWCKTEDDAAMLAWARNMESEIENVKSRDMISLLFDYFTRLRSGM